MMPKMVLLVVSLLFACMPTPTLSAGEGEWNTGGNGMAIKFEWLDLKKAKVSWTPTTDGTDQQYYIQLFNNAQINYAWKTVMLPADQSSLIIDDSESEDVSGQWNAPSGPFPGWSTYPDDEFKIYVKGSSHSSAFFVIGTPLIVPRTTREVTFDALFMVPKLDLLPTHLSAYLVTVAAALNVTISADSTKTQVEVGTRTGIEGSRTEVVTFATVPIEFADAVEANGGWQSKDVWRTICGGGKLGNYTI